MLNLEICCPKSAQTCGGKTCCEGGSNCCDGNYCCADGDRCCGNDRCCPEQDTCCEGGCKCFDPPVSHDSARKMLTLVSLGCPDGTTCAGDGQCKIGMSSQTTKNTMATTSKATLAPAATLKCQQPRSAAELEISRRDFAELEKRSGEEYWFRFEDPNVVNAGNDILPGPFRPHSKVRFLIDLKSTSHKTTLFYLGLRRPSV